MTVSTFACRKVTSATRCSTLSNLDKNEHLFAKDIVAIDLRQPDRLVVQLSDDAAKAREDALKKKDPKKKVGDA